MRLVRVGSEQRAAFLAARLDEDEGLATAAADRGTNDHHDLRQEWMP